MALDTKRLMTHSFGFSKKSFEVDRLKPEKVGKSVILNPENTGMSKPIAIDANYWLPSCSEVYNISPRIEDYIITPVIAAISDLPNTNGDAFSKRELLAFNPEAGMLAYQTFKGKPCHKDHVNKDWTIAKGVILDVEVTPLRSHSGNHIKLVHLAAFDRTRDPRLCNDILTHRLNTYSMGAYYQSFSCSICGHKVGKEPGLAKEPCSHTWLKKPTYMDNSKRLVYRYCNDITGFELSAVTDPAFISAISDVHL